MMSVGRSSPRGEREIHGGPENSKDQGSLLENKEQGLKKNLHSHKEIEIMNEELELGSETQRNEIPWQIFLSSTPGAAGFLFRVFSVQGGRRWTSAVNLYPYKGQLIRRGRKIWKSLKWYGGGRRRLRSCLSFNPIHFPPVLRPCQSLPLFSLERNQVDWETLRKIWNPFVAG